MDTHAAVLLDTPGPNVRWMWTCVPPTPAGRIWSVWRMIREGSSAPHASQVGGPFGSIKLAVAMKVKG